MEFIASVETKLLQIFKTLLLIFSEAALHVLPDGHFSQRTVPQRYFRDGQFPERTIPQTDISPTDSSPNDISQNEHFPESHFFI